jgi:hypothetical protein
MHSALFHARENRKARLTLVTATITGTPTNGQTLTCNVAGSASSKAFQWLRDNVVIAGATAATRILQAADQTHRISCKVAYKDSRGFLAFVISAPTAGVA